MPAKAGDFDRGPDAALRTLDDAEAELSRILSGAPPSQGQQQGYAQPGFAQSPYPAPQASAAPDVAQARPSQVAPRSPRQDMPSAAPRAELEARRSMQREVAKDRDTVQLSADGCNVACSALASMERAADHLCGISGPSDERCTSARDRVKRAAARVSAACPACAR